MFWHRIFFREGPTEFLDLDYLIGVDSDHVVKFRGDRQRELGIWLIKKIKNKKHHDLRGLPELTFQAA